MPFCSTRVSNELGAGNPKAAQAAVYAGVILTVVEAVIVGVILFCCRSVLGYAYSNEKEVVDYLKEIAPLLSLSVLMDGLLAVLSGMFPSLRSYSFISLFKVTHYIYITLCTSYLPCFTKRIKNIE